MMMPLPSILEGPAAEVMTALVLGAFAKLIGLVMVGRSHRGKFKEIGSVASLYIYPVKSCGPMDTNEADCTPVGLQSEGLTDRHWMILDEADRVVCMDAEPRLTLITCSSDHENIRLEAPNMQSLLLPKNMVIKESTIVYKKFYEQIIRVVYCGQEAEQWITEYIKKPAKLVFSCPEIGTRDVYSRARMWDNTARKGDVTVFAYLTSYLVVTTESLQHINSKLATSVSPINFRPNIVIKNSIPFDEDTWTEIRIGENTLFHSVEPCRRCIVTTIDPKTGEYDQQKQPLELLKTFRCRPPYGTAPIFGLYVSSDIQGHIKVGDPVYVIKN